MRKGLRRVTAFGMPIFFTANAVYFWLKGGEPLGAWIMTIAAALCIINLPFELAAKH